MIHEQSRRFHVNAFLDSTVQDLRYTVRGLLRAPMFASAAILTLALGIGMTTSIFSALAGFGVGVAGSLLLERTIHALLFQIGENDAWSLGVAVAVLFSVSLLAMIVPSLRATRVSPLQALRHE